MLSPIPVKYLYKKLTRFEIFFVSLVDSVLTLSIMQILLGVFFLEAVDRLLAAAAEVLGRPRDPEPIKGFLHL